MDECEVPVRREGVARCAFDALDLLPGAYDVDVGIIDPEDRYYDYLQKGLSVRVIGRSREVGVVRLRHHWEFDPAVGGDTPPTTPPSSSPTTPPKPTTAP
jgi:hypothetical protein